MGAPLRLSPSPRLSLTHPLFLAAPPHPRRRMQSMRHSRARCRPSPLPRACTSRTSWWRCSAGEYAPRDGWGTDSDGGRLCRRRGSMHRNTARPQSFSFPPPSPTPTLPQLRGCQVCARRRGGPAGGRAGGCSGGVGGSARGRGGGRVRLRGDQAAARGVAGGAHRRGGGARGSNRGGAGGSGGHRCGANGAMPSEWGARCRRRRGLSHVCWQFVCPAASASHSSHC